MANTRKRQSRAEYFKQRRLDESVEERETRLAREKERYHRNKATAAAAKQTAASEAKRQRRREDVKRCRRKKKARAIAEITNETTGRAPSTPKSKTKLISKFIDRATPRTTELLRLQNIKKSAERAAESAISDTASAAIKQTVTRRQLLPSLKENTKNKSAVSRRLGISRNHFYYKSVRGTKPSTTLETVQKVYDFYHREDITTTYPNKTKNGQPLKIMIYTTRKTYQLFTQEFGIIIRSTTFNKLRPKAVKLRRRAQYLQCVCDPCDNVEGLLAAIRISMLKDGIEVPSLLTDLSAFATACVCDMTDYRCLDNLCPNCKPDRVLKPHMENWLGKETGDRISYGIWEYVESLYKGKKIKKLQRVKKLGLRYELYECLIKELSRTPPYPLHSKNSKSQLSAYKKCKLTLEENEVAVVLDFAENYVCRPQKEAQSAFYGRNSTTVHPMVVVFPQNSPLKRLYVDIISPDLRHDGSAVKVFVAALSKYLTSEYPHISTLKVWSDGCGVQYKSRLPLFNIANNFEIPQKVIWNYFGSRHGKNESDGESAVVKSHLDIVTRSQQLSLTDAKACYEYLVTSQLSTPISTTARRHFIYISTEDIDLVRVSLPDDICAIPNVRRIHQVSGGSGEVKFRRLSCYCLETDCLHTAIVDSQFTYPVDPAVIAILNSCSEEEEPSPENVYVDEEEEEEDQEDVNGDDNEIQEIVNQNPELFDSDLEAEFLEDWDPEEEENERSREEPCTAVAAMRARIQLLGHRQKN